MRLKMKINFNNLKNEKFAYGRKFNIYVYNDVFKLIDKFVIYDKFMSKQFNSFSFIKPKSILFEHTFIILIHDSKCCWGILDEKGILNGNIIGNIGTYNDRILTSEFIFTIVNNKIYIKDNLVKQWLYLFKALKTLKALM